MFHRHRAATFRILRPPRSRPAHHAGKGMIRKELWVVIEMSYLGT
jgi:hypothetical protein